MTTETETTTPTPPAWLEDLQRDGYAVIPSLIDEDACTALRHGFWSFWERVSNNAILRDNPETWRNIYDYFPMHGMLMQHWCIGHMQEIWDLRSNKAVKEVFATIWGTDDLVVSFDGAATGLAPETTNRGWHRKDWLHLDQSPQRSDFECVQGWVTANPVEEGDATLTVLKGSHKLHKEFAQEFGLCEDARYRGDWLKLEEEHLDWYKAQGCEQIYIECPAGSMVLWDSRTIHAGRGPLKGRETPRHRMVAYISMMPSSLLHQGDRHKKQIAVLEGRMTSHWAAQNVKLFAKYPRTYGKPLPMIPDYEPPHLTNDGARLAGWLDPSLCPLTIADATARKQAVALALTALQKPKTKRRKSTRSKAFQKLKKLT